MKLIGADTFDKESLRRVFVYSVFGLKNLIIQASNDVYRL